MGQVDRYLKEKAMDHIDHALGRPLDPLKKSYRNYFAVCRDTALAREMKESTFWNGGNGPDDMLFFCVSLAGREALAAHLREIGDKHRSYVVSGRGYATEIIATSASKAKYQAFLQISDVSDISFRQFCKSVSVKAGA